VVFLLLLEDVINKYLYHCQAKGYSKKTMKNKRFELKQAQCYLQDKRGILSLDSVTVHDLRAYVRFKVQIGLKLQSTVTLFKVIRAFFSWCEKEEYIRVNPSIKVELPKVPKRIVEVLTTDEVYRMINAFSYKTYLEARNRAVLSMMTDLGLRAMEIVKSLYPFFTVILWIHF